MKTKIIVGTVALVLAAVAGLAWLNASDAGTSAVAMSADQTSAARLERSGDAVRASSSVGDRSTLLTVYKTPTCGCCEDWAEHMEENGFEVERVDVSGQELSAVKDRHGVPPAMRTCHTAVADGKVIEGHVPAEEVWRFLEEDRPESGLAVPGMPMGSPGMEGARTEAYAVYAFDRDGGASIYATRE